MGRRKSTRSRGLLYALAGAGVVVVVILLASYAGLFAIAPSPAPTAADQTATFTAYYQNGTAVDLDIYDVQAYVYKYEDPSELDADQLDDLRFSDFELDDSGDIDTVEIDLSEDALWAVRFNCSGLQEWWALSFIPDIEDAAGMYTPITGGENAVTLAKTPAAVSLLVANGTLGTSYAVIDSKTQLSVYNNTDDDWVFTLRATDSSGDYDEDAGQIPFFDFENWEINYTWFRLSFNATPGYDLTATSVKLPEIAGETVALPSSSAVDITLPVAWMGQTSVEVEITFPSQCRLSSVAVYFGALSDTSTGALDTQ